MKLNTDTNLSKHPKRYVAMRICRCASGRMNLHVWLSFDHIDSNQWIGLGDLEHNENVEEILDLLPLAALPLPLMDLDHPKFN